MSDIHSAVGSYVAHALDDEERTEFEQHLAVCETCTREVSEFTETLAELTNLTRKAPPPELRASVLGAIAQVRPLPPEEPVARPDLPAPHEATTVVQPAPPPVDELAAARQRRSNRLLRMVVAAAMVMVVALGGWVYALNQQHQQQQAQVVAESELMSAPDLKVYAVTMPDGSRGSYVVSQQQGRGLFTAAAVPTAGAGKTYQLWTIHDGKPVGSGLFSGGRGVRAWLDHVRDAEAVAITVEPEKGSSQPTSEILAAAKL
ncbi:hypothetical protein GCM10009841_02910 [Microlunatus panaciterrae]|uniref:Regulator of SigK n=1 Tax=Microlunatus panaciterrae TaxID=400768 RepID=A0ABS2RKF0_9ACTN|nr:anti-sigma factor [Microlunatus panaciterrae]MBM7799047.1 anti-sigma-K factor RskA [Microlunatus panaciterrae]